MELQIFLDALTTLIQPYHLMFYFGNRPRSRSWRFTWSRWCSRAFFALPFVFDMEAARLGNDDCSQPTTTSDTFHRY